MRKLLLIVTALVLLAVVLGVSYIKALKADSSQDELYSKASEQIRRQVQDSLSRHNRLLDSIQQVTTQQQLDFLTVINRAALQHRADIDSLAARLSVRDSVIDSMSRQLADIEKNGGSGKKDGADKLTAEQKAKQRQREIIDYYKKRYQSLPGDLSAYERKVALGEIRSETANKFGLSMTELESLRTKYELTY